MLSFLEKYKGAVYIASGSEEVQLKRVLERKGIADSIVEIYGSPRKKLEIFEDSILGIHKKSDVVFIGDSVTDAKLAKSLRVQFLGLSGASASPKELLRFCEANGQICLTNWRDFVHD